MRISCISQVRTAIALARKRRRIQLVFKEPGKALAALAATLGKIMKTNNRQLQ